MEKIWQLQNTACLIVLENYNVLIGTYSIEQDDTYFKVFDLDIYLYKINHNYYNENLDFKENSIKLESKIKNVIPLSEITEDYDFFIKNYYRNK
jgi:hypothetical protein